MIETKIWGRAFHCFNSHNAAVSILDTVAGGYCSRHTHAQRVNRFIVHSGVIDVVEYEGDRESKRTRMLAGSVHDVEAGVLHRFEVIEGGVVVEVYFPAKEGDKVSLDDIQRLDIGGMAKPALRGVV